jgi:hypothetical protein
MMISVRWCNVLVCYGDFLARRCLFFMLEMYDDDMTTCIMVVCHVWAYKGEVQRRRYRSRSSNHGEHPFGPPSVESVPPMNHWAKLARCHASRWWRQAIEGESSLPRSTALVMTFSHCGSIFIWMRIAPAWWSSPKEFRPLPMVWYPYPPIQDL